MTHHRRAMRFGIVTATALAVVAALAPASVSAGSSTTRWVDNDGNAGPGGCGGQGFAFKKVQPAVNNSGPNDKIMVCPGTYRGSVTIQGDRTGLTIQGVDRWAATLMPTKVEASTAGNPVVLLRINEVHNVTIRGLRLEAPTETNCQFVDVMILIEGSQNASIRGNHVFASQDPRGCGYSSGIVLEDKNSDPPTAGGTEVAAQALIAHNLVTNFQQWGIAVGDDDNVRATIIDNSIHYYLVRGPAAAGGDSPGAAPAGRFRPSGIRVSTRAHASVSLNVVQSAPGASVELGGGDQPLTLSMGIELFEENGQVTVRDNLVRRVFTGIYVQAVGARVDGNVVRDTSTGIFSGDGAAFSRIRHNDVEGLDYGIYSDSFVIENIYRGNTASAPLGGYACFDDSEDPGTVTAGGTFGTMNTWVDNTGNSDSPDGICPNPVD